MKASFEVSTIRKMPTIVTQIESVEKQISICEERLDTIERTIRLKDLTDIQRQSLKEEEKRLKKKLSGHNQELSTLRKENGKNAVISFVIVGLMFAMYFFFWGS